MATATQPAENPAFFPRRLPLTALECGAPIPYSPSLNDA